METSSTSCLCCLAIGLMSYHCHLAVGLYPIHPIKPCEDGPCKEGQYYDPAGDQCLSCELGVTYMKETGHRCEHCYSCTVPHHLNHEIVLKNCTLTRDADIGCMDGYYKDMADLICELCTVCKENEVEKIKCGPSHDRECQIITTPQTTPETTITSKDTTTMMTTTTTTTGKQPETDTTTTPKDENDDHTATIVGSVMGSLVLLVLGVFLYFYLRRFRRPTESNEQNEQREPMNSETDM